MRLRRHAFIYSLLLISSPVWGDNGRTLPQAPILGIPFDDVEPAVTQAEVTRQVAAFLLHLDRHWGESQEAVRTGVAGRPEREDRSALVYTRTLADHGVVEGYDFREGSLVRGQYVFLQRPVNGLNEFIDCYAAVKQSLTASYGTPMEDRTIWENDLYRPLPDYWGVAVQIGHLRYAATWETADGTLTIELTGNHHSRLTIEYRGRKFLETQQTA